MSEERLREIERRLDRIEELSEKLRDHPITLKERFMIHDQALRFREQFLAALPFSYDVEYRWNKELKEIMDGMCILIERALGVRYP